MNEHETWAGLRRIRDLPEAKRAKERKRFYGKCPTQQREALLVAERGLEHLWGTQRRVMAECDEIMVNCDGRIDTLFPNGAVRVAYLRALHDYRRVVDILARPASFEDELQAGKLLDQVHTNLSTVQNAVWAFGSPSG